MFSQTRHLSDKSRRSFVPAGRIGRDDLADGPSQNDMLEPSRLHETTIIREQETYNLFGIPRLAVS